VNATEGARWRPRLEVQVRALTMATPRRPYAVVRRGLAEDLLVAGISEGAAFTHNRMLQHRNVRSIPGLLFLGPAGLAETLRKPFSKIQRQLAELEYGGHVLIDRATPLLYVVGAIEADGPRTENSLKGMAAGFRELPPDSIVTREVRRAIEAAVLSGDNSQQRIAQWNELTRPPLTVVQGPLQNDGCSQPAAFKSAGFSMNSTTRSGIATNPFDALRCANNFASSIRWPPQSTN